LDNGSKGKTETMDNQIEIYTSPAIGDKVGVIFCSRFSIALATPFFGAG
jgi:hypothetical protein